MKMGSWMFKKFWNWYNFLAGESCVRVVRQRDIVWCETERNWGGEMEIDRLPWRPTDLSDVIDSAGWWQIGGVTMGNDRSLEEEAPRVSMHVCACESPWMHKRLNIQILSQFIALHRKGLMHAPISVSIYWACTSKKLRTSQASPLYPLVPLPLSTPHVLFLPPSIMHLLVFRTSAEFFLTHEAPWICPSDYHTDLSNVLRWLQHSVDETHQKPDQARARTHAHTATCLSAHSWHTYWLLNSFHSNVKWLTIIYSVMAGNDKRCPVVHQHQSFNIFCSPTNVLQAKKGKDSPCTSAVSRN